MTVKELEILITNDELLDMLIYARCQLNNLGVSMGIPAIRYDRSKLFNTLKSIKTEVESISPHFVAKCVYRRGTENKT